MSRIPLSGVRTTIPRAPTHETFRMGRGRPSQVCCSFLLVGGGGPSPTTARLRAERGWRQHRHADPPVARCACASGPGSREPPALAGAGSLRAVCGAASSPQTPSSAHDGRRAPLARAAATFRRLQKVSSLPACGITQSRPGQTYHAGCIKGGRDERGQKRCPRSTPGESHFSAFPPGGGGGGGGGSLLVSGIGKIVGFDSLGAASVEALSLRRIVSSSSVSRISAPAKSL